MKKYMLSKEEYKLFKDLKCYKLPNRVYQYYIRAVNGNENVDYQTTRKKLIRDIVLGTRESNTWVDKEGCVVSYYGNLAILYDTKEKSILWIKNYTEDELRAKSKRELGKFEIDSKKKEWFNKILRIGE